jgi:hypothetical protein
MAGSRLLAFKPTFYIIFGYLGQRASLVLLTAALASGLFIASVSSSSTAHADHLMCGQKAERRTQTVWIDPNLGGAGVTRADVLGAFAPWNQLFIKYHGLPIFEEHLGAPAQADIVVTSRGNERTWVQTLCTSASVQGSTNHSTVLLGWRDAWRNRQMLAHELGHALGLADHGASAQQAGGHVGFKLCDNTYLGVMSYCTGFQAWFLDLVLPGVSVDGGMIRTYW